MSGRAASERSFDLGDWRVSPARGLLVAREGGVEVRIEPLLMDLLVLFAGSAGVVISKDQIIASVWNGRAIGDDTLAGAVSRLRAALGASPQNRYIETVSKRGYRLAAPLVGADPPADGAASDDTEAGRLVARGLALLRTSSPNSLPQARLYFDGAIRADPARADAQAGLAETLFAQHLAGQGPVTALLSAARSAAHAAVGLDEGCAPGWAALGYASLIIDRGFAEADRALLHAIALKPGGGGARRYRAIALAAMGRFVEAEREAREAVALEPLSLAARGGLLQILLTARRYRQAAAEARSLTVQAPQAAEAWYNLGWALVFLDRVDEGVEALLQGLALWGVDEVSLADLRRTYAEHGLAGVAAAGADLFETQRVLFSPRPTDIATLRAFAGQADLAFAALETAVERNDPYLLLLPHLPWLDPLNNDPRWRPLLQRARPVG